MKNSHVRAKIALLTQQEVVDFIKALCDGRNDFYDVENFSGTKVVNARSILGMLYATGEFPDEMYLVNITNDGYFPSEIDNFRG